MQDSKIIWTHHTFNPWWGCAKVSPGCANCYAETFAKRTGNAVWGMQAERRFFADKHWNEPLKWNKEAGESGQRKRVFCASMADVFEDRPDLLDARQRLIQLIDDTKWLDWLLLTKRPENVETFLELASNGSYGPHGWNLRDHMPNVWLGTSAEDQKRWDERLPILMGIPAAVHFVSAEPLLGKIEMGIWRPEWLIVGGESGPKARPMESAWVESLRDQCDERTAFLFKQWGGVRKEMTGRHLNGRTWDEYPSPVNVKGDASAEPAQVQQSSFSPSHPPACSISSFDGATCPPKSACNKCSQDHEIVDSPQSDDRPMTAFARCARHTANNPAELESLAKTSGIPLERLQKGASQWKESGYPCPEEILERYRGRTSSAVRSKTQ